MKRSQNEEISGTPHQAEDFKEGHREYTGSGPSSCHGQGRGRTRGGRVPKKAIGLKGNPRKQSRVTTKERLGQVQVLKWKGRPRGRGGRKRGRRSIRGKKTTLNRIIKVGGERTSPKESVFYKSPRDLVEENYNEGETARLQVEVAENASGSGRSEYEEENGDASGDEFGRVLVDDYAGGFIGKSDNLLEGGNYNVDGDEDDVDQEVDDEGEEEDDGAQDAKGDFDVASYMNGEWDEEEHTADDGQQNMELGEGTRSSSSDYSD